MLEVMTVDEPQHIERLIARAGVDAARAGAALIGLEIAGQARQSRVSAGSRRGASEESVVAKRGLVIVESPAKAKTINKFLGKGFVVKASMGHVRDLPKKTLGVDEKDFTPTYVALPEKKKTLTELEKAAKDAEAILPGRRPGPRG